MSSKLILIFFYWCFHQGFKIICYSFWQCQESHSVQIIFWNFKLYINRIWCLPVVPVPYMILLFICFFVVCISLLFVVLFLNWQNAHCFKTEILLKLWLVSGFWIKTKTVRLLNNILIDKFRFLGKIAVAGALIKVVCNNISYSESTGVIQSSFKSKVASNHL